MQVGESRIGLDAPPGFADTAFTGSPRLQELAESLTSASNRILLFAISVTRFLNGTMTSLAFAETPEAFHRGQGFCHSAQDPFICRFVRTLF